jgi:AraC-like DNA-binding protein
LFTEYVTSAFPRLRQFLLPIRQHQSRFLLKGEAWFSKKVCNIFNDILSNKYTPKQVVYHFDAELKKLTLLLLYRISELSSQPEAFTHYEHPEVISKRLRKAKEIIDKTFPGNITLEALHQQLDISIRQLTNDFRKYYLMSIEEYVLLSKMDSALKWRQNGLQVKVIRIKLQYRNSGFFARSFKKTFGVNPNQVKKKK